MKRAKYPAELQSCGICQQKTRHEIRNCDGALVKICVQCLERAMIRLLQVPECEADMGPVGTR